MFYKTLSVWILVSFASTALCDTGTPCKLEHFEGVCIPIKSCKFAMSMLAINDVQTLRSMFCGYYEQSIPQVCCPLDKKTTKRVLTTTTTTENYNKNADHGIAFTESPPKAHNLPSRNVCGLTSIENRIHGGEIAAIDEFPWIARIKFRYPSLGEDKYACSGTLINDRYVLTAAHCVVVYKPISVRLGEWDTSTVIDCEDGYCNHGPVDIDVENFIVYPSFNKRNIVSGDIALLRLKRRVNYTDFILPICLPTTEYVARQDYTASTYTAAGWGLDEFDEPTELLLKVTLNSVPYDTCALAMKQLPKTQDPSVICAGGQKGRDTCQGDSGGPLQRAVSEDNKQNWYLYGITSFGVRDCGSSGKPSIYTRVTKYMDWILKTIGDE